MSRRRFSSEKELALARSFSATVVPQDFLSVAVLLIIYPMNQAERIILRTRRLLICSI